MPAPQNALDLLQHLLQSAHALRLQGDLARAEELCRRALEQSPGRFEILQLLGEIMLQRGNLDEAAETLAASLRLNPKSATARVNLGIALGQLGRHADALASFDAALAIGPNLAEAHCGRGIALANVKRDEEALASLAAALAIKADYVEALRHRGRILRRLGRRTEALTAYQQAIAIQPDDVDSLDQRARILLDLKSYGEAVAAFDQVLAVKPDDPEAFNNRGNALGGLERYAEALADYDHAIELRPNYAEALINRGAILWETGRFQEALASCDRALSVRPNHVDALNNRAVILTDLARPEEALATNDRALEIRPGNIQALKTRAVIFKDMERLEEALQVANHVLEIEPDDAEALNNRGLILQDLGRADDAIRSFEQALASRPDYAEALNNRAGLLLESRRFEAALASFDEALVIRPDYAKALSNRGNALAALNRWPQALADYERAVAIDPDHPHAWGGAAKSALQICDWPRTEVFGRQIRTHIIDRKSVVPPFTLLGYCDDPALHLEGSRKHARHQTRPKPLASPPAAAGRRQDRIRIAYLSADFHRHATAYLTAGLFELHDRRRFDVSGISLGPDDGSEIRARLIRSFDQFHDVSRSSDVEATRLIRDVRADILVDLKGHTQDARLGILAQRLAPIQVNYLGYPGTMGAPFIDYILADAEVLPFDQQAFYDERIVYLPDCYQVNDLKRRIADRTPARQEAGLPDQAVVFCCFNNNWKITRQIFDVWIRLLTLIDRSVLWLIRDNVWAADNLRREAAARGIDPERLVFADRLPLEEHLARHRLADLFLDTLPYNAHTTASDALWAGLPVLTCRGEAFAGRVTASLLNATGLADLIVDDLQQYEALALSLVKNPARLTAVRDRLTENRLNGPLFDTDRFRRHIEVAYETMHEIWRRGDPPRAFSVAPRLAREGSEPPELTVL